MPIPLVDGSVVGDGSQLGIFPALADQSLDKPSNLLRSSTNPRMDLVLLIVKDAAASSGTAAAAPPGMSVAQFALVQRMLAARQRGAAAASGGGAPEPKRGPQIHLVLWRMGDDSSIVWSVPLSFDKVMDPPPGAQRASQQEHEDVHLHDLTWSPKGDRVALLASVRRSPVASSSTTTPRTSTLLRTYSVQDGRLLSTVDVQSHHAGDFGRNQFTDMMTLQWLDIDFAISNDAVDGSSESLLAKLPPLPALPAADTFASAGNTGSLMPHQLRMMQMSGQKPPPSFQYPSHLALQGRGALAKLPYLAKSNSDLGLLEGGDACFTLDDDSALPLLPETVVLVANANSARATLVLDGQTSIGSLQFQQHSKQGSKAAVNSSSILSLSHDMTQLTSISAGADTNILCSQLSLPLPLATRYGPSSIRHRISAVSRASHLLRFYLGYALDSASALQQVYQKEVVQKVTKEWTKNIDDLSSKFGGDMKYELINVLLTGRAGPAAEQFLLANLTEGVLARLEQQSHTAMYAIKKLISESLRPALERCIACLTGLLGQVSFFGADDGGLREGVKLLQVALDSTLSLAKDVDLEALISQEFYRWFRTERERQERIKQDQDEPRLPVTYDVHFVASYIDRGFENEQLRARMADTLSSETLQSLLGKSSETRSLSKALEEARTFLAATSSGQAKGNVQKVQGEKKAALAIVPVINKAVEVLGEQLVHLLDGDLGRAEAEKTTISITPAIRGWSLTKEPTPALSLSSSIHTQGSTCRIRTASYLTNETLITAYPLQSIPDDPASTTSILALRFHALVLETAHFTISTDDNFSILDLGFYGDAELLILATLLSTSTSVLLAFNLADLPFSHEQEQKLLQLPPSRATEFDKDFKAGKLAVNTNKQTVAVSHEKDAKRIVYLDISFVEVGGMPMQEQD